MIETFQELHHSKLSKLIFPLISRLPLTLYNVQLLANLFVHYVIISFDCDINFDKLSFADFLLGISR